MQMCAWLFVMETHNSETRRKISHTPLCRRQSFSGKNELSRMEFEPTTHIHVHVHVLPTEPYWGFLCCHLCTCMTVLLPSPWEKVQDTNMCAQHSTYVILRVHVRMYVRVCGFESAWYVSRWYALLLLWGKVLKQWAELWVVNTFNGNSAVSKNSVSDELEIWYPQEHV